MELLAQYASSIDKALLQYAIAPFIVALFTVMVLHRLRLGGLAVVAAFAIAVTLTDGWQLEPLTPLRKIASAPFRPTRGSWALGSSPTTWSRTCERRWASTRPSSPR